MVVQEPAHHDVLADVADHNHVLLQQYAHARLPGSTGGRSKGVNDGQTWPGEENGRDGEFAKANCKDWNGANAPLSAMTMTIVDDDDDDDGDNAMMMKMTMMLMVTMTMISQ